jgi:tetratricopeptide (TPR) repeat protein
MATTRDAPPTPRPGLLFKCGRFLTAFKLKGLALRAFRAVTRRDPGATEAWSCIGFILAERRELGDALEAFERARALAPEDAAAQFNAAFVLQRLGRNGEAIEGFRRALALEPGLERARSALERSEAQAEIAKN